MKKMSLVNADFKEKSLENLQSSLRYKLNSLELSTDGFSGNIEVINKVHDVKKACDRLSCFNELSVDCEGVDLGRGGKLTLLQITAKDDTFFIFDILVLGKEAFNQGLKEILESKEVIKYMFDCRCDSDSLFHEYNIKITNVLDMQLFEFMVRPSVSGANLRGPSRPGHFRKPCIRGLDATRKTYVNSRDLLKTGIRSIENVKSSMGGMMKSEPTVWRYRPIHTGLLRYAALDVEMIWLVKECLSKKLALQGVTKDKLKIASERYAALRRDHEKPDDVYLRHPIMLSNVFPEYQGNTVLPFLKEDTKCFGCKRLLTRSSVQENKCGDCMEIDRASPHRY